MTTPAKPEPTPTPYCDAHSIVVLGDDLVYADKAKVLERHLRRIVEAWDEMHARWPKTTVQETINNMDAAIQAANETLSK